MVNCIHYLYAVLQVRWYRKQEFAPFFCLIPPIRTLVEGNIQKYTNDHDRDKHRRNHVREYVTSTWYAKHSRVSCVNVLFGTLTLSLRLAIDEHVAVVVHRFPRQRVRTSRLLEGAAQHRGRLACIL